MLFWYSLAIHVLRHLVLKDFYFADSIPFVTNDCLSSYLNTVHCLYSFLKSSFIYTLSKKINRISISDQK